QSPGITSMHHHAQLLACFLCAFSSWNSCFPPAHIQSSMQPGDLRWLKGSSCLSLSCGWNYRHVPLCLACLAEFFFVLGIEAIPASASQSAGIRGVDHHVW
ncbi:hypothetical protein GW7_08216, partial [Heterocephalus glaber]